MTMFRTDSERVATRNLPLFGTLREHKLRRHLHKGVEVRYANKKAVRYLDYIVLDKERCSLMEV